MVYKSAITPADSSNSALRRSYGPDSTEISAIFIRARLKTSRRGTVARRAGEYPVRDRSWDRGRAANPGEPDRVKSFCTIKIQQN